MTPIGTHAQAAVAYIALSVVLAGPIAAKRGLSYTSAHGIPIRVALTLVLLPVNPRREAKL